MRIFSVHPETSYLKPTIARFESQTIIYCRIWMVIGIRFVDRNAMVMASLRKKGWEKPAPVMGMSDIRDRLIG
jgi:hypothetical protein